jgi:ribosomal protein S18 acetylase RimI-like enzyme
VSDPADPNRLRRFEEAGFNAWPALQTRLLDGWVVRLAGGYTKRANSVNPTYPSLDGDLRAKVDRAETIYRARGLPLIFRLTSFGCPPGLDELLTDRGYRHLDPTLVMTRSLTEPLLEPRTAGALRTLPLAAWLAGYVDASDDPLPRQQTHAAMLEQIGPGAVFGALAVSDLPDPVAYGLAVVDGDLVGLFDIVTPAAQRNRGYGGALVTELVRHAADRGATTAYLQVTEANAPAQRLYRALGFTDAYRYWYRIAPPDAATCR